VTLLEIARGLGYLRASGWQPARTIVIAGWGGDDVGLAGSLAYANRHWLERARRCIAYVSADRAVTGPTFTAGASPALAGLALAATESVPDPAAPTATIFDRWTAQFGRALPRITLAEPAEGESFPAQSGTPIVTMRFSGAFGVADTADDTLAYARRWTDPDFSLHRAAAQLDGIAVLRLADGETVPYVFGGYPQILRDAMNRLAARATANGVSVDLTAFERSVDRLATAAVAVDRRFGLATDPANAVERELRAARELDAVVTDTLADDRSDHADAKPDAAVDRATGAVGRATDDLTF
jgi:N-acetylated-alpha-linked acidic dipeptidase